MNLILVSGRYRGPDDPSRERDARVLAGLQDAGVVVRHIEANGALPPFRDVYGRIVDTASERRMTEEIRRDLPDLVHQLGFGGGASVLIPWLADRLGAPSLVSLDATLALCHRGTLVNERGESCVEWRLAQRCAACTLTPFDGGLGPIGARLGRLLNGLRLPSPYPDDLAFENRLETVVGGLVPATFVQVGSEAERTQLVEAGVAEARLRVGDPTDTQALMALYEEVVTA